ncbi:bifunctional proline dehydrogenase/L-glutamate gamma-semialdehyde dehydrogenase PutA [Marinivivus vitaminiproducens]|uniref:bifunctional proline dehydrogenase/L-glutamate gamma-semialdehyde dehydrogenase PutA n=1 Tax=Marinivivus vitaminiproducens TaxID=3035935 RepID=UPI0027A6F465|nr:bifunctional proline dehydrogenase/L-glutamate gamma-semialdehyde dehydrogenase PutA [Geminicoccaceae bacterium SCSIO 64248]
MDEIGTATASRDAIRPLYRRDETLVVETLLAEAAVPADVQARIRDRATALVRGMRTNRRRFGGLDDFLQEFGLSTKEGVALMCLAEALQRVPDAATANRLIRDKIGQADWAQHVGAADTLFVNASTWALMLTGRVLGPDDDATPSTGTLDRLVARAGEPVIRGAVNQAMSVLGRQFVMGRTIGEALANAREPERHGYTYSYDMLGEGARTAADAERYFRSYEQAIAAIGKASRGKGPVESPGISVKLSALHPRYSYAQAGRAVPALTARLLALALQAKSHDMGLCVDAEEADRLEPSLDVIERVFTDPRLGDWQGFGLAIQAYQKRARPLIAWLEDLAGRAGRRLMVRLVKGAYWDSEIKWAQERGLAGYPVFTRKLGTDVSYIACARAMLDARDVLYPMFATHNAQSVASILELADGQPLGFEFQRLHGMGEPLYHQIVGPDAAQPVACRVYAPVGSHEDLLPYLVRRLLENGANSSFVNRIRNDAMPLDDIVADPAEGLAKLPAKPHPKIPLPCDLYGAERVNSQGVDLTDPLVLADLLTAIARAADGSWQAGPIVAGRAQAGGRPVVDPADTARAIGRVRDAEAEDVEAALASAARAAPGWSATPAEERAACLERLADRLEGDRATLMAIAVREAGKTLPDAVAELREAVDFCRYYALQARRLFAEPVLLPGPTGERNLLALHGRGVFLCISPWNFPLAIFTGQMTAALAAGNAVICKPAEQTPLMAAHVVRLAHQAGIPVDALHLLPGPGETVGAQLVSDPRIAGIAFTGGTDTARAINRTLAERPGPIVPFIAETGGQNAMIVDATALPEQVVDDAVTSGFLSAGQRCSALRVLFLQDGIADRVIRMLEGATAELVLGDPLDLATDIGPVIDADALKGLEAHKARMAKEARLVAEAPLGPEVARGHFLAPAAYAIDRLDRLEREVFGPVVHVVRYRADRLDAVIDAVNATGYGLTLGVHSRIDSTVRRIQARAQVGNVYVNRNMVGAVVGVQPFGGERLSGTGPKAGGPHYLLRFAAERSVSVNTTAAGGNTSLVTLAE